MSNSNSAIESRDTNAYSSAIALTSGLGDLSKLPKEIRDMVYKAVLAKPIKRNEGLSAENIAWLKPLYTGDIKKLMRLIASDIEERTDIKVYLAKPYHDLLPMFLVSVAIRKDTVSIAIRERTLVVRGHRAIHRLTTYLSANDAFGSVRSLEIRGMNNIRTVLGHISKFPALHRVNLQLYTRVLAPTENCSEQSMADSIAKVVQKYRLEKLLVCTTLRYVTLEEFTFEVYSNQALNRGRALRGLGRWLEKECDEKKMDIHVGLVQAHTSESGGGVGIHATTVKVFPRTKRLLIEKPST
jgi:hypothetical protein